jgi:hypothetical protein
MTDETWWLDSAEEAHAAAPDSYFIPPASKRENLTLGDEVKLLFRFDPPVKDCSIERMWVEVVATDDGAYRGELRNSPEYMTSIAWGDSVTFGPEHVAAYVWDPAELGYDAGASAWAPKGIVPGSSAPRRVSMRPPNLRADENDSGWLLCNGDEPQDVIRSDAFGWLSLGWLTDLFPDLEPVLRAGDGEWRWDEAAGEYRRDRSA